jgi:DinB superfamily
MNMSQTGYIIADAFDVATDHLVTRIRAMSDDEWSARASEDSWTVAQEALHLGVWMDVEGDWFGRLAHDKPTLPLSGEAADGLNAQLIAANPEPSREQVLLEIAGNRTLVRHLLIGLSETQFERTIPTARAFVSGSNDTEISIGDLARRMLVGHIEGHMEAIEKTIEASS